MALVEHWKSQHVNSVGALNMVVEAIVVFCDSEKIMLVSFQ